MAEFICIDQIPIYTVDKCGFKQLVRKLNSKYELPSRNFFMNNEIPKMYTETRETIKAELEGSRFYACTTDLWSSRTMQSYMAVSAQFIKKDWQMQSWCLGCAELNSDHTAESLSEAFTEMLREQWGMDLHHMAGITTDNASNNKKAFTDYNWIPCFGHNIDLAIHKGLNVDPVANTLSRLRRTISAFSRSTKLTRQLKSKQADLGLPLHKLIHDEPTRWGSTFDMVHRFLEQQQAVYAVLTDNRSKWHLMPKESDVTTMEALQSVIEPLRVFTDALSGEQHPTISSVLPLLWKAESILTISASDSNLTSCIKKCIRTDLQSRYNQEELLTTLRCCTFLDPRFKDTFVSNLQQVEAQFLHHMEHVVHTVPDVEVPNQQPCTKPCTKSVISGLLTGIMAEKRGATSHAVGEDATFSGANIQVRFQCTLF